MLKILGAIYNSYSKKGKLLLIVIGILILISLFYAGKFTYYKYKYFKSVETELIQLKEKVNATEETQKKAVKKAKKKTKAIQTRSKQIDLKLKKDVEIIKNTPVDNDKRKRFIAKYQTR